MPKDVPLHMDLFTGELVDSRSSTQKRRDEQKAKEAAKPKPIEMFAQREVLQFGITSRPTMPLLTGRGTPIGMQLEIQDPRSEEEKEADRMKAAQKQTVPLFGVSVDEIASEPARQITFPSGLCFPVIERATEECSIAVKLADGVELLVYTSRDEAYEEARDSHDRLQQYRTWERGSDQLEIWKPDQSGYYLITYCSSKEMIDDIAWVAADPSQQPKLPIPELPAKQPLIEADNKPIPPLVIPQLMAWSKILGNLEHKVQAAEPLLDSTPSQLSSSDLFTVAILSVLANVAQIPQSNKPVKEQPAPSTKKTTESFYVEYMDIKKQFPQAVVLLRIGDFLEAFGGDAELIARELDLVLTSRQTSKEKRTPMAGVPHFNAQQYINRLVQKGYHIAVCEPVSTDTSKGLNPREVVRVAVPPPQKESAPKHAPQDKQSVPKLTSAIQETPKPLLGKGAGFTNVWVDSVVLRLPL